MTGKPDNTRYMTQQVLKYINGKRNYNLLNKYPEI